jgi:hypothetical protein
MRRTRAADVLQRRRVRERDRQCERIGAGTLRYAKTAGFAAERERRE